MTVHLEHCPVPVNATCLQCQVAKSARGVLSGQYSVQRWTKPVETEPDKFTEPMGCLSSSSAVWTYQRLRSSWKVSGIQSKLERTSLRMCAKQGQRGIDIQARSAWIFEHLDDPALNEAAEDIDEQGAAFDCAVSRIRSCGHLRGGWDDTRSWRLSRAGEVGPGKTGSSV
jgi:hypothetical protein